MLVGMWRKGTPCTMLVGKQTGVATAENRVEVPQKITSDINMTQHSTRGYNIRKNQKQDFKEMFAYCTPSYLHPAEDAWVNQRWYIQQGNIIQP